MTNITNTVLLLIVMGTCCLVGASTIYRSKCSVERDREMDKCAAQLGFLGNKSFKVPKNMTQMDRFCSELKDSLGCIQNYSRQCLTSMSRQVLTTIIRNGKQTQSRLCKNDKSKQEFMQKMACLVDDKIDQFHRCMDGSVARYEYIASKYVQQDDKIVSICCSGQIFQRELQDTVGRICHETPDSNGIENTNGTSVYLHQVVSSTMGSFTNLVCDGYQSYQDCKKSPRMTQVLPKLEEVTNQIRQNKLQPKAKSLISVLLVILTDQKPANDDSKDA